MKEKVVECLALGLPKAEIARKLGRLRSSIGREIERNIIDGRYSSHKAQKKYRFRQSNCGARRKLDVWIFLFEI